MILNVPENAFMYPPGYGGDPNRVIEVGLDGLPGAGLGATCYEDSSGTIQCVPDDSSGAPQWNELPSIPSSPSAPGGGFNWATLPAIIAASGQATSLALRAGQPVGTIPGTNTIFDPVTGRFTTTSGVAAHAYGQSLLPVVGIVVVGIILVFALKK